MANRVIEKEKIDGKWIEREIRKAGYSIRSFTRAIGCGDRTLRNYLEKNEMPDYLMHKVFSQLSKSSPTLWVRVGFTVCLPRDMIKYYIQRSKDDNQAIYGAPGYMNVDLTDEEVQQLLKYATADGDSYIPATCLEQTDMEWFLKEEMNEQGF